MLDDEVALGTLGNKFCVDVTEPLKLGPITLLACCYSASLRSWFIDTNGTGGCLSVGMLSPNTATLREVTSFKSALSWIA